MKATGSCPKCGHNEIIRAKAADYNHGENDMAVTADPRWFFDGRNPSYPHGRLYTYTCRSCGFTEWYAEDPESIPIGSDYETELI